MIECLTVLQLYNFTSLLDSSIIEYVEPSTVIIHAALKDVHWIFDNSKQVFCIKN